MENDLAIRTIMVFQDPRSPTLLVQLALFGHVLVFRRLRSASG